jgi:hypothetical protein
VALKHIQPFAAIAFMICACIITNSSDAPAASNSHEVRGEKNFY